jgi:hypothetical protein
MTDGVYLRQHKGLQLAQGCCSAEQSLLLNTLVLRCAALHAVCLPAAVVGSPQDSILQLFTIMFGDMQFSTLKTILSVNTVASRLAVFMAAIYAVLVLIVLVNLLIAM